MKVLGGSYRGRQSRGVPGDAKVAESYLICQMESKMPFLMVSCEQYFGYQISQDSPET